jgi:hypothetical protein
VHTCTRKETAEDKTVAVTLNEYLENFMIKFAKYTEGTYKCTHRLHSISCVCGIDTYYGNSTPKKQYKQD